MLPDSNIIIYAAQPEYTALRPFIEVHAPVTISRIEVLGYHKLMEDDRRSLTARQRSSVARRPLRYSCPSPSTRTVTMSVS